MSVALVICALGCAVRQKILDRLPLPQLTSPTTKGLVFFLSLSGHSELELTRDWNQMRKNHVDNMNSYFTRKEERLKAKKMKAATEISQDPAAETKPDDNSPQGQSTVQAMDNLPQAQIPPHKKSKLETEPVL